MSFLERITAERREDALRRRAEGALEEAKAAAEAAPPVRDFEAALRVPGLSLIAEIKRASPSKGVIAAGADEVAIARAYEDGGAAAVSVLTEPNHFRGTLEDLRSVRSAVEVPVLRKDFVCDELHVYEARAAGADAVLLIVAALTQSELVALIDAAAVCGMAADVEVHDPDEVGRAVDAGARIVAINARNLATLDVDLATVEKVRPLIPGGVLAVAESGIETVADVRRMRDAGVDAVHIGETLMRAPDPAAAIRDLLE
ncbi:MAG TPA: indole-3-glycerol phosphate synthase TrpC [Actinomycetota bacterium]|nr:indole-3-glycerol phosphate synthase TrpC [Actinomycetota bacterium]